jgi:hypothetical protein
MSFVVCQDSFRDTAETSRFQMEQAGLWDANRDVRWKLTRQDHKPIDELSGSSAGGAFTLGLARLLAED